MARKRKSHNPKNRIIHPDSPNVFSLFWPSYDEVTLFLMALTSLLLLIKYKSLVSVLTFVLVSPSPNSLESTRDHGGMFIIWMTVVIVGMLLSFAHPFIKGDKLFYEKTIMATFALTVNGITGIYAGIEMLSQNAGGLLIFPTINILSGAWLIYQLGLNPDRSIQDADASILDVFIGIIALSAVYFYCETYLDLGWATTFSICIAYATLIHRSINKTIGLIRGFLSHR